MLEQFFREKVQQGSKPNTAIVDSSLLEDLDRNFGKSAVEGEEPSHPSPMALTNIHHNFLFSFLSLLTDIFRFVFGVQG